MAQLHRVDQLESNSPLCGKFCFRFLLLLLSSDPPSPPTSLPIRSHSTRLGRIIDASSPSLSLSVVVDDDDDASAAPVIHNAAYRPNSAEARDAWEEVPSRIRRRRRWTWGGCSMTGAAAGAAAWPFIIC